MLPANEKKKLKTVLEHLGKLKIDFKRELGKFLPKSSQPIIKKFPQTLAQEIRRHI